MGSRSNTYKRVSVNYGDLSEDMLKLAASKSNRPSPIMMPKEQNASFPDTDANKSLDSETKTVNDEALAKLSGMSPEIPSNPAAESLFVDELLNNNKIPALVGENGNTSFGKSRRMSYMQNSLGNSNGNPTVTGKRHSINYNEYLKNSSRTNGRPPSIVLPKNSNRYSSIDGSDPTKMRLMKQMLSPIDTSGSESYSPHAPSPTGLGLDSIIAKSVPKKVKDIDDDDDDDSLNFEYPKSPSFVEREINPFVSPNSEHQPSRARTIALSKSAGASNNNRHLRSNSVNFHSRNKSLSAKPTYSPVVNSPMLNINSTTSFEDIKDEYPHCVPLHTTKQQSLLSLMKIFPDSSAENVSKDNVKSNEKVTPPGNNVFKPQKTFISLFGLKNLLILLFVVNNFGLLLEYYNNYFTMSSVFSLVFIFRYNTDIQFFFLSVALTPIYYLYTYIVEKVLYLLTLKKFNVIVRNKYSESKDHNGADNNGNNFLGVSKNSSSSFGNNGFNMKRTNDLLPINYLLPIFVLLYLTNIFLIFAINNIIIIKFIYNPILGTVLEIHTIVSVLKVVSFALTNKNLRELYFKSINSLKYHKYLKQKKRFINADGTFNVIKEKKSSVDPELLNGRMTGLELAETINTLKQRKNSDEIHDVAKHEQSPEIVVDFIDQNLQPKFYDGNYYPDNISINETFHFSIIPTLIYQPIYPKTMKINWKYVFDKVVEIVGLTSLIFYLSSHYAIPILKDSLLNTFNISHGFQTPNITPSVAAVASKVEASPNGQIKLIEILIKLADVSILIWLITYYVVFHDYLNLLAELTMFDDRNFYEQWWNSGSVSSYWKTWNKVFSNFFERHFYRPLMISRERNSITGSTNVNGELNASTDQKVNFLIFFIMAVLQELVVGVPTGNIMGISFICIIMQSPLSILTKPLDTLRGENSAIGNIIFWVSFMIGQPLCILLYYFTWNIKYGEISSY